jgi:biopolymer transport protein ExbB
MTAPQMGLQALIEHMGPVNWMTFAIMVIMGLATGYYAIRNTVKNMAVRANADNVVSQFWATTNPQEAIRAMESFPANEPFSKIALECAQAAAHHAKSEGNRLVEALNRSEFIDRSLRQAVTRESAKLEEGLTLLATVGSTAPFVGLFGTVWGIYNALIQIGASGDASLDRVAGPVGEALIMTCIGLAVAIPAVLAYNFFVRANRVTLGRFDEFAHDLHDYFATGARVGGQSAGGRVPTAPKPAAPMK